MTTIGLAGGRGYVGEELLTLLAELPDYEVVYVGSRSASGKRIRDVYPNLESDLVFQSLSPENFQKQPADIWIIAQPNGLAEETIEMISQPSAAVIDISSDFRFDPAWTYGLPERNAAKIRTSKRIANPGCYATAVQLGLLPLRDKLAGVPVAFGVSGFSGAGRTPSEKNDPIRLKDNLLPYALINHTHEREISHHLGQPVRFMPHVASFFRGISISLSIELNDELSERDLLSAFQGYYANAPLVEVIDSVPEIRDVRSTNRCVIGGFAIDPRDPRRISVVSVIDNLRKGAASQAIQNMNLITDRETERGLLP